MPQFGASLSDDSRTIIYNRNMFISTGQVLLASIIINLAFLFMKLRGPLNILKLAEKKLFLLNSTRTQRRKKEKVLMDPQINYFF
jgi:hypothetical protein